MEKWLDISGYEGLYQVSNLGMVKRVTTGRLLKPQFDGRYYHVVLCKNNKSKTRAIHRLVAETFIPNPDKLPTVNHKDEDKLNNTVLNLEWCTQKYNINYGVGLLKRALATSKPVLCIETGIRYQSAKEAERVTKIDRRHICDCCRGKRKTTGGCHWQYAIKQE